MAENELLNELKKIHRLESHKKIEAQFNEVANKILNEYILIVKNEGKKSKYRITEIEFYYNDECDKNEHPDPYTHYHEKNYREWRFHGSGIDIAIGGDGYYGGILLRGLQNIKHHYDYIDGPLLVSERILNNANSQNEKNDLKKKIKNKNIFNTDNPLCLIKVKEENIVRNIYQAPRVNLTPKRKKLEWYKYIVKNYRYLLYPEKTKNGKELLILSMIKNRNDNIYFSYILKDTLKNYKDYYEDGEKIRNKKDEKEEFLKELINEINTNFGVPNKCKLYGLLNEGDKK
jgi:hypothetical protein